MDRSQALGKKNGGNSTEFGTNTHIRFMSYQQQCIVVVHLSRGKQLSDSVLLRDSILSLSGPTCFLFIVYRSSDGVKDLDNEGPGTQTTNPDPRPSWVSNQACVEISGFEDKSVVRLRLARSGQLLFSPRKLTSMAANREQLQVPNSKPNQPTVEKEKWIFKAPQSLLKRAKQRFRLAQPDWSVLMPYLSARAGASWRRLGK